MARLNQKPTGAIASKFTQHEDATVNHENALAFKMSPKQELVERCATWFVNEPKFYDPDGQETMTAVRRLIGEVAAEDPEFILKTALYCRRNLDLRSAPIVLLVEAAFVKACSPFIVKYAPLILSRADQPAEALAYVITRQGKDIGDGKVFVDGKMVKHDGSGSIPNALKKGIARSLKQFGTYHFSKYDKNTNQSVKMRDVFKLCHPDPRYDINGERYGPSELAKARKLYKQVLTNTLPSINTWETNVVKGTKEEWNKSVPTMPYFALLKNLRNMIEAGVDMKPVIARLTNPEEIKKSKTLPFRFYVAYDMLANVPGASKVIDALQIALDVAIDNIPRLKGKSAIFADQSGSMDSPLSSKNIGSRTVESHTTCRDIANLFTAMGAAISEDALTAAFADKAVLVNMSSRDGVLSNMNKIARATYGGTNGFSTIRFLMDRKEKVDRIIINTDTQMYDTQEFGRTFIDAFIKYRKTINPDVYLYFIDLAGYGTMQFPEGMPRCVLINGWSDSILRYIAKYEGNKSEENVQLQEIEAITVPKKLKGHDFTVDMRSKK